MKKTHLKSMVAAAVLAGLSQQALAVDTTFTPSDDTWIQPTGDKSFHTVTSIRIDKNLEGYAKFNVEIPVGEQITSAILRLTATSNNDIPDAFIQKVSDPGDAWTEDTLVGDTNDFVADGTKISASGAIAKDTSYDFDVSVEFQGDNAITDQAITFLLDMEDKSQGNVRFYSSNHADTNLHPQLIITTEPASGGGDDTTPPTFADNIPTIEINATGLTTDVSSLISITADDETDPDPIPAVIDGTSLLPSGIHTVTLKATDAAGNSATKDITVNITPLSEISSSDGAQPNTSTPVTIDILGPAVVYPVTLEYSIGGEATTASSGTLIFNDETEQTVDVAILPDATNNQTATFAITSAINAQLPLQESLVINVLAGNVAPTINLTLEQNGLPLATINEDNSNVIHLIDGTAGAVTVTADIIDVNNEDTHSISWDGTSENLAAQGLTFDFEPAELSGHFNFNITATEENTDNSFTAMLATQIRVITESFPVLATDVDSDGDGIFDSDEGFKDSDGDGIVDYLDNSDVRTELPLSPTDKPLQTTAGLTLSLGSISTAAQGLSASSAIISLADLTDNVSEGSASPQINGFIPVEGASLLNFNVQGLAHGAAAPIVYPLPTDVVISEATEYQKYTPSAGWTAFAAQGENSIKSSVKDTDGNCPAPNDESYNDGLNAGDNCIQLTIVDGGIYDADGEENGAIEDPGILAESNSAATWNTDLITIDPIVVNEGEATIATLNLTEQANDADGDALTYSKVSGSDAASIDEGILTIHYDGLTGEHSVVVDVSDGNFTPAELTVTFSATVNSAPVFTAAELPTAEQNVAYMANIAPEQIIDAEGNSYVISKTGGPHWLNVSATGELSGTPRTIDVGMNTINIEIVDSEGASSTAEVRVEVTDTGVREKSDGGSFTATLFALLGLASLRRRRNK